MSVFPSEMVRVVAEAGRFPTITDDVCRVLAADLEYRIREIAQDAAKFTRHGRRRRMTTDDINAAMRVRNMEPVYGYPSGSHTGTVESLFKRAKESDVFYIPDTVKRVHEIIGAPLPSMPAEMTFTSHWLAIEGEQPTIPQNPPVHTTHTAEPEEGQEPAAKAPKLKEGKPREEVEIKQLEKHTLSREQQLLFNYIIKDLLGADKTAKQAALKTLSTDHGLHQLVPFFMEFIRSQTTEHASDPNAIASVVGMVDALVQNNNVYLEPYLHHVIPVVATCAVSKKLASYAPDHLALRVRAAQVAVSICVKYGTKYHDLQPRILKVFQDVLKRRRSLLSYYGAIKGLAAFGPRVVDLYLVDAAPEAMRLISLRRRDATEFSIVIAALRDALLEAYKFLVVDGHAASIPETRQRYAALVDVVPELSLPALPTDTTTASSDGDDDGKTTEGSVGASAGQTPAEGTAAATEGDAMDTTSPGSGGSRDDAAEDVQAASSKPQGEEDQQQHPRSPADKEERKSVEQKDDAVKGQKGAGNEDGEAKDKQDAGGEEDTKEKQKEGTKKDDDAKETLTGTGDDTAQMDTAEDAAN
ncbi:hypothetical protein PTSG_00325 [Salpingoeca rosetta]|uniref:TATA box binding protein associated factor (TAF) histone-like fold domain-containing protein n=1 Tax=Salpingoeca rosetta (strain ATCC 50818 / BSB-021) TaxID=946362 RepID=F2TW61_SALR5|nr:uncharacterized protein PTSG_00325 [Salpingoeca rosetta]EGD72307.1 hypothetical protein PTSG_00325 [Salpingoeca rosetta]|eukprot:XP_004998877.1 hypothetical protein PTSG_00325 [Salpingoeca rosetta]